MVTIEQLRISDDGQCMFLDAHVNKASYFDEIYIKKLTICTEDQVSEINPFTYGEDFIYQEKVSQISPIVPIYDKVQILSEQQLLNAMESNGGWAIDYQAMEGVENNYLSIAFSGKFSQCNTRFAPKLLVTTNAFNPATDNVNNGEVLFAVDGVSFESKGHQVWQFKGKGEVKLNTKICFYIYNQTARDTYSFVRLDATDDRNFLHFLWQIYAVKPNHTRKELHRVFNCNSFNEKFTAKDLSHNMFFVYIECDGTPAPDTPCRLDEMITLGVTYDYGIFYNQAMNYTRELADTCNIPQHFMDFIFNLEALKLAVETEHYVPAIQHWENLLHGVGSDYNKTIKPCGCHG